MLAAEPVPAADGANPRPVRIDGDDLRGNDFSVRQTRMAGNVAAEKQRIAVCPNSPIIQQRSAGKLGFAWLPAVDNTVSVIQRLKRIQHPVLQVGHHTLHNVTVREHLPPHLKFQPPMFPYGYISAASRRPTWPRAYRAGSSAAPGSTAPSPSTPARRRRARRDPAAAPSFRPRPQPWSGRAKRSATRPAGARASVAGSSRRAAGRTAALEARTAYSALKRLAGVQILPEERRPILCVL